MASLRAILNPDTPITTHESSVQKPDGERSRFSIPSPPYRTMNTTPTQSPQQTETYGSHHMNSPHPFHENCPDSLDCLPDTNGRPQHTLPIILRCAILGSPKQRLTIRDIYAAMEAKYPYYRTAGPAWKQSVRHHLSLNRLFERQAKPVTEPGFGSYWTVNLEAPPGTKRPRKRGRQSKANTAAAPDSLEVPRRNISSVFRHHQFGYENGYEAPPMGSLSSLPTPYTSSHRLRRIYEGHHLTHEYDDELDRFDPNESSLVDPTFISDDAYDSEDDTPEEQSTWVPSFSSATFPPSPSRTHTESSYSPGQLSTCVYDMSVDNLREEVRLLRRQAEGSSAVNSRMADDLAEARLEISRLRQRNELLEKNSIPEVRMSLRH